MISAMYTPNNLNDHIDFWNKIRIELQSRSLETIDFRLGDFNITEDSIDYAPVQLDNENVIDILRDLRNTLHLQDTWRMKNPHQILFTFSSNH